MRSVLLALTALLLCAAPAGAATITVDSTEDPPVANGNCSLREAIRSANTGSGDGCAPGTTAGEGGDTIVLPTGTFTLAGAAGDDANASGDLDPTQDTIVEGAGDGPDGTIIDANDGDRAFDVQDNASFSVDVELKNMTVRDGSVGAGQDGGAIRVRDPNGTFTLTGVTVEKSDAGRWGGALSWDGSSNGDNSPLKVIDSEIVGNTAGGKGGGVYFTGTAEALFSRSTFTGNDSGASGGAIYIRGRGTDEDFLLTVVNSTVTGNTSDGGGAGIGMGFSIGRAYVFFSTIANNTSTLVSSGGGIQTVGSSRVDLQACKLEYSIVSPK